MTPKRHAAVFLKAENYPLGERQKTNGDDGDKKTSML